MHPSAVHGRIADSIGRWRCGPSDQMEEVSILLQRYIPELPHLIRCILFSIIRHWLFGEKVNGDQPKINDNHAISDRCRGWFPRKCAVELVCPDSDEDQEHFNSKKIN